MHPALEFGMPRLSELREKLAFWKTLLNLDNWRVTLEHGSKEAMGTSVGINSFSPEEEFSQILIARGEGEETVLHELLHLVFDGHKAPDGQPYSTLHERAINRTARALMALRYAKKETT